MTEMVEVTKEDANNYCRVLAELGIEDEPTDPVTVIQMLRSWEADANARADRLTQHLNNVLEIARTWQPDYATKMDRDTLDLAAAEVGDTTPNAAVSGRGETKPDEKDGGCTASA